MSDHGVPAPPPAVDHPELADALQHLQALESLPLAEHHDRLAAAHEVLHRVLQPDDPAAG